MTSVRVRYDDGRVVDVPAVRYEENEVFVTEAIGTVELRAGESVSITLPTEVNTSSAEIHLAD